MTTRRAIELEMDIELAQFRRRMQEVVKVSGRQGARAGDAFADGIEDGVEEASEAAKDGAKDAGDAWSGLGATIGGALAIGALAEAASQVFDYVSAVTEARTETINLSKATGISTSTFGAFELAASRSGVEVSEILGGFEDFGEVLFDFTQGGGRAEEALRTLGFTSDELTGRLDDVNGVAIEAIERMRGIEDAGLRNAVAQQLFGDAGNRLNAVLGDAPLDEWIAAAQELGVTVDDRAVKATEDWNQATATLGNAFSTAGGELVTLLQEAATPVIRNFALGFVFLRDIALEAIDVAIGRMRRFVGIAQALFAGDFTEAFRLAGESVTSIDDDLRQIGSAGLEGARGFFEAQRAIESAGGAADDASASLGNLADNTRDATDRAKELQAVLDFNQSIVDELAAAHAALGEIAVQAASDLLSPLDEINLRRDAELAKIRELEQVTGETAQSRVAAEAVVAQAVRERDEVIREIELETAEFRLEQDEMRRAREEGDQQDRLDRQVEFADVVVDVMREAGSAIGDIFDRQIEGLSKVATRSRDALDETQTRIEELNQQILESEDARLTAELELEVGQLEARAALEEQSLSITREQIAKQFKARKALEITATIISGAAAGITALGPPPTGAGPIIGAGIAIGVGIATAAAVAKIASQQPPQFHVGFPGFTEAPDEFQATLRGGEAVTNQRATDALGGPTGVAELNATGRMPAPPEGAVNIGELGRLLGRLVAQEMDAGRELTRRVNRGRPRRGVRPVYQVR